MIKNWLIRGDTHGNFLWMTNGCLDNYKPEETAIIVLGDFGVNYYLNNIDQKKKKEICERGYTFYAVRGNHEARPQNIKGMSICYDANVDGMIYKEEEYPNIRYFTDYGIYNINNYKVAVIGGAYSVDKWWRLQRVGVENELDPNYFNATKTGWFCDEQLSEQEMAEAAAVLKDKKFDFVFTHTCPYSWRPTDLFLNFVDQSTIDKSMELWMNKIKNTFKWKVWCFGHYHADRLERPYVEQYFNDIESLDVIANRWKEYDKSGKLDWWLSKGPNFYMS